MSSNSGGGMKERRTSVCKQHASGEYLVQITTTRRICIENYCNMKKFLALNFSIFIMPQFFDIKINWRRHVNKWMPVHLFGPCLNMTMEIYYSGQFVFLWRNQKGEFSMRFKLLAILRIPMLVGNTLIPFYLK